MIATREEIVANMHEAYRIARTSDGAKDVLSRITNSEFKKILENFFYLGYIYGAESVATKIKDELPSELLDQILEALRDARDG